MNQWITAGSLIGAINNDLRLRKVTDQSQYDVRRRAPYHSDTPRRVQVLTSDSEQVGGLSYHSTTDIVGFEAQVSLT